MGSNSVNPNVPVGVDLKGGSRRWEEVEPVASTALSGGPLPYNLRGNGALIARDSE